MSIAVVRQTSVPANAEAAAVDLRVNRRGELVTMPWYTSLVLEGKVFTANAGTISAPVTLVGTAIVVRRPQLAVKVPSSSTIIIPLYMALYFETQGGAGVNEVAFSCTANDILRTNGTAITPVNMLRGSTASTACEVDSIYSGDSAAYTSALEFYRSGYPTDASLTLTPRPLYEWSYLVQGNAPVIKGPASLIISSGAATSQTGFVTITWAEFTATELA